MQKNRRQSTAASRPEWPDPLPPVAQPRSRSGPQTRPRHADIGRCADDRLTITTGHAGRIRTPDQLRAGLQQRLGQQCLLGQRDAIGRAFAPQRRLLEQFQHGLPVLSGSQRPFVLVYCIANRYGLATVAAILLQSAVDFSELSDHLRQIDCQPRQAGTSLSCANGNSCLTRMTVHGASIATLIGMVGLNACSFSPCVAAPITITVT